MLWARPVWNTWWTWDPRLTTTLIMWFVYVAYLMLRGALDPGEQGPRLAAVLGVIGFLNVPLVYYSARIWRTIHPIIEDPSMDLDPVMHMAFLSGVAAFTLIVAYMIVVRRRLLRLQAAVDVRKFEAIARTAGPVEELS
jgi:heme exporter protein C